MTLVSPELDAWLRALPPERLEALARRHAERARRLGLAVTQPDGSEIAIPPVLSPSVIDDAWFAAQARDTARLAHLVHRVAEGLLAGPERPGILDAMAPFERACIERAGLPSKLATVRADLFLGEAGARALELNATIPAMQGYSDVAVRSFLETVGPELGLDAAAIERAISDNGENAMALLGALRAFHRARTGREPERIALVHRENDAQVSELRYLARRWERAGIQPVVVEAGQISVDADGVRAAGQKIDFLYRHIFARRVEPESALAGLLREPSRFPFANPVSAPLEMKRVFAELSRCASEPEHAARFDLEPEELELVKRFVPWTRPLIAGQTHGSDGARIDELVEHVAANPGPYVLKRSWDYGGRAVFLGFESELEVTRERAAAAFGEPLPWAELVRRAAGDARGGGFVVQERVVTEPHAQLLVTAEGPRWLPMFEDFSLYASVGLEVGGWGGVVRASRSAVVNIVGGGGVAPVLRASVARALEAAAKGRP